MPVENDNITSHRRYYFFKQDIIVRGDIGELLSVSFLLLGSDSLLHFPPYWFPLL